MTTASSDITLPMMREHLYSAVVSDALDGLGFKHQSPRLQFNPYTGNSLLVGRCKTTLWVDMAHVDPSPYELELKAVDANLIALIVNTGDTAIDGSLFRATVSEVAERQSLDAKAAEAKLRELGVDGRWFSKNQKVSKGYTTVKVVARKA